MTQAEILKKAGFPNTKAGRKAFHKKYPTKESFFQEYGMPHEELAFGGYFPTGGFNQMSPTDVRPKRTASVMYKTGGPTMFPQIQSEKGFFSMGFENVPAPYQNGSFAMGGYLDQYQGTGNSQVAPTDNTAVAPRYVPPIPTPRIPSYLQQMANLPGGVADQQAAIKAHWDKNKEQHKQFLLSLLDPSNSFGPGPGMAGANAFGKTKFINQMTKGLKPGKLTDKDIIDLFAREMEAAGKKGTKAFPTKLPGWMRDDYTKQLFIENELAKKRANRSIWDMLFGESNPNVKYELGGYAQNGLVAPADATRVNVPMRASAPGKVPAGQDSYTRAGNFTRALPGMLWDDLNVSMPAAIWIGLARLGEKAGLTPNQELFPGGDGLTGAQLEWKNLQKYRSDMERDALEGKRKMGGYAGFGEGHPFPYQPRMPKNGAEAYGRYTYGPKWLAQNGVQASAPPVDYYDQDSATLMKSGVKAHLPSNVPPPVPTFNTNPSPVPNANWWNDPNSAGVSPKDFKASGGHPMYDSDGRYSGLSLEHGGQSIAPMNQVNQGISAMPNEMSKFLQKLAQGAQAANMQKAEEFFPQAQKYVQKTGGWIKKATASIKRRGTKGVCTGSKFGGPTCPPGSRRYNLAKVFKKMARNRAEGGEQIEGLTEQEWMKYVLGDPEGRKLAQDHGMTPEDFLSAYPTPDAFIQEEEAVEQQKRQNTGDEYAEEAQEAQPVHPEEEMMGRDAYAYGGPLSQYAYGDQYNPAFDPGNLDAASQWAQASTQYSPKPTSFWSGIAGFSAANTAAKNAKLAAERAAAQANQTANTGSSEQDSFKDPKWHSDINNFNIDLAFHRPAGTTKALTTKLSPNPMMSRHGGALPCAEDGQQFMGLDIASTYGATPTYNTGINPDIYINPDASYQWNTPALPVASLPPGSSVIPPQAKQSSVKSKTSAKEKDRAKTGYDYLDAMLDDFKATPDSSPSKYKIAQRIKDTIEKEFPDDYTQAPAEEVVDFMTGTSPSADPKKVLYAKAVDYIRDKEQKDADLLHNKKEKALQDYLVKLAKMEDDIKKKAEGKLPSARRGHDLALQKIQAERQRVSAFGHELQESYTTPWENTNESKRSAPTVSNPAVQTFTAGSAPSYSWADSSAKPVAPTSSQAQAASKPSKYGNYSVDPITGAISYGIYSVDPGTGAISINNKPIYDPRNKNSQPMANKNQWPQPSVVPGVPMVNPGDYFARQWGMAYGGVPPLDQYDGIGNSQVPPAAADTAGYYNLWHNLTPAGQDTSGAYNSIILSNQIASQNNQVQGTRLPPGVGVLKTPEMIAAEKAKAEADKKKAAETINKLKGKPGSSKPSYGPTKSGYENDPAYKKMVEENEAMRKRIEALEKSSTSKTSTETTNTTNTNTATNQGGYGYGYGMGYGYPYKVRIRNKYGPHSNVYYGSPYSGFSLPPGYDTSNIKAGETTTLPNGMKVTLNTTPGFLSRITHGAIPPRKLQMIIEKTGATPQQAAQIAMQDDPYTNPSPIINDPNNPGHQISVGPGYKQALPGTAPAVTNPPSPVNPQYGPWIGVPPTYSLGLGLTNVPPSIPPVGPTNIPGRPSLEDFMNKNVRSFLPGPPPEEQFPGNNPSGMAFGGRPLRDGEYEMTPHEVEMYRHGGYTVEYI